MKPGESFGKNVSKYAAARRGLPVEVLTYIKEKAIGVKQVLDLGCGTGIVTRQMVEMGLDVIGSDIDAQMMEQAVKDSEGLNINYVVNPANNIPFSEESFDMVTAFSAFHWFYNKESTDEIKRVLRPNGLFLVLNGEDEGPFKKIMREVTKPFIPEGISRGKENYEPKEFLIEQGFKNVEDKLIQIKHDYSINEAILFVQSTSNWAFVPEDKNEEAVNALRKLLEAYANNGIVERPMVIKIVSGRKA